MPVAGATGRGVEPLRYSFVIAATYTMPVAGSIIGVLTTPISGSMSPVLTVSFTVVFAPDHGNAGGGRQNGGVCDIQERILPENRATIGVDGVQTIVLCGHKDHIVNALT